MGAGQEDAGSARGAKVSLISAEGILDMEPILPHGLEEVDLYKVADLPTGLAAGGR